MKEKNIDYKEASFTPTPAIETKFSESQKLKQDSDVVPIHIPKNWNEQFYLYKDGGTYRLYINIDNTWKYIALT